MECNKSRKNQHLWIDQFPDRLSEPTGAGVPPSQPYQLSIRKGEVSFPGNLDPLRLAGLGRKHLGGDPRSLAKFLQEEHCTLEGPEQIAGVDCYRVGVRPRLQDRVIKIWLDAEHGSLPRREEDRRLDKHGAWKIEERVEISRFSEWTLPSGEKIWFPAKARMEFPRAGVKNSFELEELTFRESPPVESFRIDPEDLPAGVFVRRTGEEDFYTGGEEGRKIYEDVQKLYGTVRENLEQKLGPPPHTIPAQYNVPTEPNKDLPQEKSSAWLITNLALLMVLAGGWMLYRIRHSVFRKHV
jgi:hypothetical protein